MAASVTIRSTSARPQIRANASRPNLTASHGDDACGDDAESAARLTAASSTFHSVKPADRVDADAVIRYTSNR